MPVIERDAPRRRAVGIVVAQNPMVVGRMEGQRIADSSRTPRRRCDSL